LRLNKWKTKRLGKILVAVSFSSELIMISSLTHFTHPPCLVSKISEIFCPFLPPTPYPLPLQLGTGEYHFTTIFLPSKKMQRSSLLIS
jgi:hypothetical protein